MGSPKTIKKIFKWACDELKKKDIAFYQADAEILICHVLNIKKDQLFINFNKLLSEEELIQIKDIILRRAKYEPVAYITGHKFFYDLSYHVNKNVLIPRPESELLVEEILNYNLDGRMILDIGTGSGNLGITIKKAVPGAIVTCCDISLDALDMAGQNGKTLLKTEVIEFIQSDIYSNIFKTYDFIVSNPPYVLTDEISRLQPDIINYEPIIALDGGNDGMTYYKRIIQDIKKYLNPGGYLFLEINPFLKDKILNFLINLNLSLIKIKKDYNGFDRIMVSRYEN